MDFNDPRLQELLGNPAEHLAVEIKEWLNLTQNTYKAKLAQALIALANHGGGIVLIGYAEQATGIFIPAEPRPPDLSGYTSDVVNEISRSYLNPSVHCDVGHVAHPISGLQFPVINVPGGHQVPIMARRGGPQGESSLQAGRVYIRRVGPASEEPQTPDEWRALFDRCIRMGREELVDRIRLIVAGASLEAPSLTSGDQLDQWIESSDARWRFLLDKLPQSHPARFPLGFYRFAYQLVGDFERPSFRKLKDALANSELRSYSWPHWPMISRDPVKPTPIEDTIECFLAYDPTSQKADPDCLDYWRVSITGQAYTVRGLNEDSHLDLGKPGVGLDITTPTRRLADAITHASNLARELGMQAGSIDFDLLWSGLAGRRLVSMANQRRHVFNTYRTQQQRYRRRFSFPVQNVSDQLPEIVDAALRPMYEAFDFFQLPADLAASEIAGLRRHN